MSTVILVTSVIQFPIKRIVSGRGKSNSFWKVDLEVVSSSAETEKSLKPHNKALMEILHISHQTYA